MTLLEGPPFECPSGGSTWHPVYPQAGPEQRAEKADSSETSCGAHQRPMHQAVLVGLRAAPERTTFHLTASTSNVEDRVDLSRVELRQQAAGIPGR
jgi:hypothetical protein